MLIDSIHTLNKLAGASDEMGTFIRGLNEELKNKKNREEKINNLSIQLSESNLGREQCEGMVKELESLKETNLGTWFYQSDSTGTSWATPGWLSTNGQGKTYCYNRNCHNYDPCAGGECEDCLNGSCSFQKP